MTKSTITRNELNEVIATYGKSHLAHRISTVLLAAMDSEPHIDDELSNLMWYSQEATCHSDPNYYCEFQRLATPGLIAGIIRELQERRKVDSEPVAWTWHYREQWYVTSDERRAEFVAKDGDVAVLPLYRHAQPAPEYPEVLPCSVLLEPRLRFGKGIKTSSVLAALARRAVYESDMAALSQEERAEFQARIEDFKALIAQPVPVVPDVMEPTIETIKRILPTSNPDEYAACIGADMWNACRAAMLQELKKSAGTEAICRSNENVQAVEVQSLTSINPAPDLVSLQKKAESIIGNYPGIPDCWCCTCRPVVLNDMRFVVCPDCGNKRCPRANDHRNACTGSNEPGQEGSAYPDTPQEEQGE
ncbi:hypothetical protein [Klebsiella pneumoniae]|uniref:hypothetical protein n=1 Tax=Klebsiella pneumoniae TaxID=573 RepID=UPI000E2BB450|nr:hypothetical protein [Klebsiella pneumoniae]SWO30678.1 Uncharacterised protein [Klebsiella pneumoniae]